MDDSSGTAAPHDGSNGQMGGTSALPDSVELLVVGAGPVGLFAALCAARQGLSVRVIDDGPPREERGYATLLHAHSLRLLAEQDLAEGLKRRGQLLSTVSLSRDGEQSATLALAEPVLAIPQRDLEHALHDALIREGVLLHYSHRATTIRNGGERAEVSVMRVPALGPSASGETPEVDCSLVTAEFVLGADGHASQVRSALGIEAVRLDGIETYSIFEVEDDRPPRESLELAFHGELGSSRIPLANGRVRLTFQILSGLAEPADGARLAELVSSRMAPAAPLPGAIDFGTVTHFDKRLARLFGRGRVWLAGDAAHVTSPLGAQSLNLGLAEAAGLVRRIADREQGRARVDALALYAQQQQREWQKLLGVNVLFSLLPDAPRWVPSLARRLVPALPLSGPELDAALRTLGIVLY
ncbi:MAG TPA: NAD(P)/FAD-dependent oxidoreductase [Polyangiaceae bacterium]|nr:NAD(P)/FAD-dependent oxidoreductase [Polyangiaceae bacterium]